MSYRELKERIAKELLKESLMQVEEFFFCLDSDEEEEQRSSRFPCFECGSSHGTHWHHIIPRSFGGKKTIPLCSSCHGKAHHKVISGTHLIKAGLERARKRGVVLGRKRITDFRKIYELRDRGVSIRGIAKMMGISKSSVQNYLSIRKFGNLGT